MKEIKQQMLTGERQLYGVSDMKIIDTIFDAGESPLKECRNLEIEGSSFKWKYPLWYDTNVSVKNTNWFEMARAGVWYTNNISVKDALIQAPKNFRRCDHVKLENVTFTDAAETFWNCKNVELKNVSAKGNYFAMNTKNLKADGLILDGNYSFDGGENLEIRNSKLLSKDAFWNCENVTVYDSYICGEYLGWNSKNLTFVNCTIESNQGMCYIDSLKLVNCKLINTVLAFEFSDVDADVTTKIDSVLNPKSGVIKAKSIGELIVEKGRVDIEKTKINAGEILKTSEKPEWFLGREEY